MTKEEFFEKKDLLRREYNRKEKELDISYSLSKASVKEGDFFTDHTGTIIVEKIIPLGTFDNEGIPSCAYNGTICNKDGKPNKTGKSRTAYECNNVNK
jgi:hypothetical protein